MQLLSLRRGLISTVIIASSALLLGGPVAGQSTPPTAQSSVTRADGAEPAATHRLTSLDPTAERALALQVALDRAGFSPGEIDGRRGRNTDRALRGFQRARGLPESGDLDARTTDSLGVAFTSPVATYAISAADVAGPYVEQIPADMMEKAALPSLGYTSVIEMLGERFHMAPALLQRLNPEARFERGEIITVPNVEMFIVPGADTPRPPSTSRGDASPASPTATGRDPGNATAREDGAQADAAASGDLVITVTEESKTLTVETASGEVVFQAPVTTGSQNDPLPVGDWTVTGVHRNPTFHYNPDLFWDADPAHAKATLAPGPNNPVGVVWIDLSKPHYGIHGTPEPSRIGYSESHGCIRLTNWDAMRVAALVSAGTKVVLR